MKSTDLRPGHRIAHTVPHMTGTITVTDVRNDVADARGDGWPELGRVYATVVVTDDAYGSRWDAENLPKGTGADSFTWLGLNPLRYRLAFLPDADVTIEESPMPDPVRTVSLPLTTYQLSALRLVVGAEVTRIALNQPHDGPGPDPRDWPVAMRAIADLLDPYSTVTEAATALATHYLKAATETGDADHG